MENALHPFERAGLGKAPFRFVGITESKFQAAPGEPVKAGSSCDYCPAAIMTVCHIVSADGRRFKVGCDCVRKVDAKLGKVVSAAQKELNAEKRFAAKLAAKNGLEGLLATDAVREKLAALPHPKLTGRTMLDWADWMCANAGTAGRKRVLKAVAEVAA